MPIKRTNSIISREIQEQCSFNFLLCLLLFKIIFVPSLCCSLNLSFWLLYELYLSVPSTEQITEKHFFKGEMTALQVHHSSVSSWLLFPFMLLTLLPEEVAAYNFKIWKSNTFNPAVFRYYCNCRFENSLSFFF